LQDIGAGFQGRRGGIELIDIVFAFSNVKLVRGLVLDNIRQLETMDAIAKGQNEGLKAMIMQKQKTMYSNLSDVENVLGTIIDANVAQRAAPADRPGPVGLRTVQLNEEQSQAFVSAIVFAIHHMAKFIPGTDMGNSGLPQSVI
jgi:hypothetical protein